MEPTPVLSPEKTEVQSQDAKPSLIRGLGLLDSVLLLVSGIIGSSIFLTAKDIATPLPHPVLFLLVWVFGALISLCACFAFAELGSMFPDSGGQYIYLREAYGDLVAFLYGWMLFMMHLVHADGVISRPFAVIQALAKRKRALVKCSSNGQSNVLKVFLREP